MNTTATLKQVGTTNRSAGTSPRKTSRIAGGLYLIIVIAGILAFFLIRGTLIVPGDAAATAANITASEQLFRFSIGADLIMILSDVALAIAFYVLLKPVSRALALLAAFFRLAQAATLGLNLLNLSFGLKLLSGVDYLSAFSSEQLQSLALLFFEAHAIGYTLCLVFFGLSILVLGYLIYKSGYIPKILGVLLIFAAFGYLTDSFAQFLLINYADYADLFGMVVFGPALISELALAIWLLVRGVSPQAWERGAIESN